MTTLDLLVAKAEADSLAREQHLATTYSYIHKYILLCSIGSGFSSQTTSPVYNTEYDGAHVFQDMLFAGKIKA